MKLAVTYENGMIFQHFGHTKQFKIYEINDDKIESTKILDSSASGHGALATLLKSESIDALICGGIGGGAKAALADNGIMLYSGASGNADEVVKAFLDGTVIFNSNVTCNHHDHDHHEGCGGHECHCH